MFLIDLLAFLLSVFCTVASGYIYRLIGGKGRIITTMGFAWLAVVRGGALFADDLPTRQLATPFYVLLSVGLIMLILEIRDTLKRR